MDLFCGYEVDVKKMKSLVWKNAIFWIFFVLEYEKFKNHLFIEVGILKY